MRENEHKQLGNGRKRTQAKDFYFLPFEPISPDVVLGREFIKSRMQQISFSQ